MEYITNEKRIKELNDSEKYCGEKYGGKYPEEILAEAEKFGEHYYHNLEAGRGFVKLDGVIIKHAIIKDIQLRREKDEFYWPRVTIEIGLSPKARLEVKSPHYVLNESGEVTEEI